jgi:PBSX family phage terminase large subunit
MPKQDEFVHSNASEILYSGAFGAGKTRALCYRAVRLAASDKRVRVGLTRKTMVSLKGTTLVTLIEPDGDLPPVLPAGSYDHHKVPGEEQIQVHGGGKILLFGCDNPQKVGSLQLTDCCVDEAVELDSEEWGMLLGRCRVTFTNENGTKHKNTLSAATNPGDPSHFLHDLFFKQQHPARYLIQTSSMENWFLPADYVPKLQRTMHGAALLRYVKGIWAISEGSVYPMFAPGTHCIHRPGPWLRYVAGVDWGFRSPMAVRVHGVDGDGRSHVVAELYRTGVMTEELAAMCKETAGHYGPIVFVVDPSAAELIRKMRMAGLSAFPANNDVQGGIAAVQNALARDSDGQPRLTMEPGCNKGNMEYLSYRWKETPGIDAPVKKDDHACDSDRYAVMYINHPGGKRRLRHIKVNRGIVRPRHASQPLWN